MTISWIDNTKLTKPRYLSLAHLIDGLARSGRLGDGEKLPPQRQLAYQLEVTVGTVGRAYDLLNQWGTARAEVGRGTYITHRRPQQPVSTEQTSGIIDLATGRPVLTGIAEPLIAALGTAMRDARVMDLLDYGPAHGGDRDRLAASLWLSRLGMKTVPDRVIVTQGIHAALAATIAALSDPGETILVESLAYKGIKAIARVCGRRLEPVRRDKEEIDLDHLKAAAKRTRAGLFLTSTNAHNPTTGTLPLNHRYALAERARETGLKLIEDDACGPLMCHGMPPLVELAPERTVYLTSLSKLVAPGLRVGVALAPQAWIERLIGAQCALNCAQSSLAQTAFRLAVEGGLLENARRDQRLAIARRHTLALARLPDLDIDSAPDCPHLWLHLPDGADPIHIVQTLAAQGILVSPGSAFRMRPGKPVNAMRISLGGARDEQTLSCALDHVARAVHGGGLMSFG